MRIEQGELTVDDVGVSIVATTDETLTGLDIDFIFIKPSGESIRRDASSISGLTATYTTASGDIDEAGLWHVYLYNNTTGFYYNKESGNRMTVRPKPEDMAKAK
jgi:hypothetical protein